MDMQEIMPGRKEKSGKIKLKLNKTLLATLKLSDIVCFF